MATEQNDDQTSPPNSSNRCSPNIIKLFLELKSQRKITLPLMVMNLTWFAKIAITTSFLGRLGELQLAGGTLGFTFANVTGFSVLNGLCAAMEPICGQAYGAKNFSLLRKTLFMGILLLLLASVPIFFLFYLLPDLVITSFLCPLKAYLSSQSITLPIMFSSGLALALHVPVNILLVRVKGIEGVSMAIWITDFVVMILLALYLMVMEKGKWKEGGWWDQNLSDWIKLIRLSGPCCLTTCLEWWCYEILVLLTGRLPNARQAVGVLAIVLNFDYLLYSGMLSLSTCASIRVSNALGSNQPRLAYRVAYVSLGVGVISGCIGASTMVGARGVWGSLFSHNKGIIRGVKELMLLMALMEVVNFPLAVCGGIVRGTARPRLAMYANLSGFYLIALPLGAVLAFKVKLGLGGLLVGFFVGMVVCLALLVVFILNINWEKEAGKAQTLTGNKEEVSKEDGDDTSVVNNDKV